MAAQDRRQRGAEPAPAEGADAASLDDLAAEPADPRAEQPLAALERRERRGDVLHALLALPDAQRAALTLREYQGLSYDEIGDALGLDRAATTALLDRARCSLRRRTRGWPSGRADGCPELAPQLSAMLDAELDAGAWRRVERHVADCRRCKAELRRLRGGRRLHAAIPLLAPPSGWSWAATLEAARTAGGVAAAGLAADAVGLGPTATTGASLGAAGACPAALGGLLGPLGGHGPRGG